MQIFKKGCNNSNNYITYLWLLVRNPNTVDYFPKYLLKQPVGSDLHSSLCSCLLHSYTTSVHRAHHPEGQTSVKESVRPPSAPSLCLRLSEGTCDSKSDCSWSQRTAAGNRSECQCWHCGPGGFSHSSTSPGWWRAEAVSYLYHWAGRPRPWTPEGVGQMSPCRSGQPHGGESSRRCFSH